LLYGKLPDGEHKGLIAIIPGPEIAFFENLGHRDLCNFLPIAENTEFRLTHEDFLAPDNTRFTTFYRKPVIGKDLLYPRLGKFQFSFLRNAQCLPG